MQAQALPPDTPFASGLPRFAAQAADALAAWRQAYAARGAACAADVGGEFAVALDLPGGGSYLAVDRFAVHSLCYAVQGGRLHYATRADDLARRLGITALDPQAIFDYLFHHCIPSPRTIYTGILRLPPAHYALFENGQLTVAPYWTPRFTEQANPDFGALRDEFRGILRAAVKGRLGADGKTACFLSGGTDSSTVAGLLGEATGKPPASYSIGFEAEGYDEMAYARIAAKAYGADHHEYYVTPADLVKAIPAVAAHYDQPFGNSSAVPAFYCASKARADGYTRMLAGDGGDELFGGNTRYAKERVFHVYSQIPSPLRAGVLNPLFVNPVAGRIPLLKKGTSYIAQARVPMPDRMQSYNLLDRLGLADVLTPAFLAAVNTDAPREHQRATWNGGPHEASLVNQMLAFDWRYTLAENDLPKVVGTTGLAGIDVSFPLLDTRLLDFSLKLPTSYKLKGLKLRWFFKEALRGFLPDEILTKKKHGFGLPFGPWAVKDAALNALAADSLRGVAARGIVRTEFVESLLTQRLKEHAGYYGEMVWILMMLEQWLRRHAPDYRL
ncbi:asparagine synthetase B family protein [Roseateles saccharophilus]|uniref:asparagine synthase (glutamine-hydrolyzing) n=1 Tax=Roseateles saccharophilus TaxID=304 RepID=A0A4R3UHX5_ROSSA|nr:asparagine synthase C-terminal domain-containing protein [Roseateles saccharophilus]MDG0835178.1 asparagine synthase [Roseateles saccharophilus]TCU87819.1 asparagine synthase (glutamine-hydrolysing) [Roseateles saccharophilus]